MDSKHFAVCLRAVGAGVLVCLALAGRLSADDRDSLRTSAEAPYVFLILDTSGSMNWTTRCTAAQLAKGDCRQLCTDRDCFTPLNADDPASKFYQAKEALYEVLSQVDNINFGFATYNQDGLNVASKHWLYKVTTPGITLEDSTVYPPVDTTPAGQRQCSTTDPTASCDVFGRIWPCTQDSVIGCWPGGANNTFTPARLSTAWEAQRVRRLPKLGDRNNTSQTFYIRSSGVNYEVTYDPIAGPDLATAATVDVKVSIKRCTGSTPNTCNTNQGTSPVTVTFQRVAEFLSWENGARTSENERGFFAGVNNATAPTPPVHYGADTAALRADQPSQDPTCLGWDPNGWTAPPSGSYEAVNNDPSLGYNLRWPTTNLADARGKWFYRGDVLPLDWRTDNQGDVLQRLAPIIGGYNQAPYFKDHPNAGESFLRLRDEANRPLLATGKTPLGDSIKSFRNWYAGCPQGNCPKNSGWKEIAAAQDPNWGCRKKFLIVLTDGDETCGGGASACSGTASLRAQEGILTFVVAFGVQGGAGGGNTLTCMAANGGTGDPIYPQNKQELVDELTKIFTQVKEEARAFASAAVPSVEANVKDKLFLSDFTPLTNESIWDGHIDAFLKPLPEKADGTPDDSPAAACGGSKTAGCHLWDAGDKLVEQAPDLGSPPWAIFDQATLKLGLGQLERRVYYPGANGVLTPFMPPTGDPAWIDLFKGMGFKDYGAGGATLLANKGRANEIIGTTLTRKKATINLPLGGTLDITYVMGDNFHSDLLVTESPHDLIDFNAALQPNQGDCRLTTGALSGLASSSNYRCFVAKQQTRRKLVLGGTNDGQLHAFDAGTFDPNEDRFSLGTGREAFSVIPRMALPIVRDDAETTQHIFGVDGPVVSGDVFFDSDQGGDDEWHTISVVGTREGGRKLTGALVRSPELGAVGSEPARFGYMTLDITAPDALKEELDPRTGFLRRFVPKTTGPVPGCAVLNSGLDSGCARPFPSHLWEFTDRSPDTGAPLDEDNNGDGDLGAPWSRAVITRVKLQVGPGPADTEIRPVVIVGGGLDATNLIQPQPRFGNFIYMLDARTGQPIYKREVAGSVPAVAVLDSNDDNVADFVYFGTTVGRVYKVDVRTPQPLQPVTVRDMFDQPVAGTTVQRVTAAEWEPFQVFLTGDNSPIFQEIKLLSVHKLGRWALAVGTGNRESLWDLDGIPGRFYLILDENWTAATGLTEDNYRRILPGDANLTGADSTPLFTPTGVDGGGNPRKRGWYLFLDPNERVITEAFAASGILIFSSFQPTVLQEGTEAEPRCVRTGESRNFIVFTVSANAVTSLSGTPDPERWIQIADFVTSPFTEQVQTQNVTGSGGSGPPPAPPPTPYEADCNDNPRLKAVVEVLKDIGPRDALYGNFFLRVGQRMARRGVVYPACIPVGIYERNWKEN